MVSAYGGTPRYRSTAPGPALYAARANDTTCPRARPASTASVMLVARKHMYRPCASMASAGSSGELTPLRFASLPHAAQVVGMNWVRPWAPTRDTARGLHPDSA